MAGKLELGEDAVRLLQTIPLRGSIPGGVPTDSTIYRFYEMVQIDGSTLKALAHEQFGHGIISAINFKLDIRKVDDPQGAQRAVITLDGKYLPTRPFCNGSEAVAAKTAPCRPYRRHGLPRIDSALKHQHDLHGHADQHRQRTERIENSGPHNIAPSTFAFTFA